MKVICKRVPFVDINDLTSEFERLSGLKFNHNGIHCSPNELHLVLNLEQLNESYDYFRGHEQILYRMYTLNELLYCNEEEVKKWKDVCNKESLTYFITMVSKSIYDPKYPNSSNAISISLTDLVKFFLCRKELPKSERIIFWLEW